jgi:hypothetical protein
MAKFLTYAQVCTRFANLATTGISIEDAVQEAVDAIYETGRYIGTTTEIVLSEDDFIEDTDLNCYFVYLDESTYDGVIGFRCDHRGWGIMDHTALYKDGVNAGDMEFIDYGTITRNGSLVVSGITDPEEMNGELVSVGTINGKEAWSTDGLQENSEENWVIIYWSSGSWFMMMNGEESTPMWVSNEDVETPDLVTEWLPGGSETGDPVLTLNEDYVRKYRCPLGWSPSTGPYYALIKLEAPELENDTVIKIASARALKYAILAVCQEYVSDDERALMNWQKFEAAMQRKEKQTSGPKKNHVNFESSLRRKPSQFM